MPFEGGWALHRDLGEGEKNFNERKAKCGRISSLGDSGD